MLTPMETAFPLSTTTGQSSSHRRQLSSSCMCETDADRTSQTSVQLAMAFLDLWECLTPQLSPPRAWTPCTGALRMHLH